MQYICVRKCYVKGRIYVVGETESFEEGSVPKHFKPSTDIISKKEKPEPKTFHGINKRNGANAAREDDIETRKVIESLGHKVNKPVPPSNVDPFTEEDSGLSILD